MRQGANDGTYVMELTSGERFEWNVDVKGKEMIKFFTDRNIKTNVTKELNQHYFPKTFDVDRFLNDPPSLQKTQLQKIAGIDFSDMDRQLAAAIEDRQYARREMEKAEAQRIQFEPEWSEVAIKTEPFEKAVYKIAEFNLTITTFQDKLKDKKFKKNGVVAAIKKMKEDLEAKEQELMQLENEIDLGDAALLKPNFQLKTKEDEAKAKQKLEDIRNNNAAILAKTNAEKKKTNFDEAEAEVKRIEADKKEAIETSSLPDGFSFSSTGILYNGLPFDRQSLSSSAIYIGALKLASTTLGEVKMLHFDASLLDRKNLEEVQKWASQNNLQLLIERPAFEGGEICYEIIEEK